MKILIKNGTIVNHDKVKENDILIEDGVVARIGAGLKEKVDQEIDAANQCVIPGFVDLHVHLRSPGRDDVEDLLSGSKAAAKGGYTTVFCMPNTQPAIDHEGLARWVREESERIGIVDIFPIGAITQARQGKELTEFGALKRSGVRALSDDGVGVADTLLLRRAFEYARIFDLLLISHCEDASLSQGGVMRESFVASQYGMPAVPDIAESLAVARDIELAKYGKGKLHLAHISCAKSIPLIAQAKKEKVVVTAETCPHYFILTVDDIAAHNFDASYKVNPPLGEKHDVEAVIEGLRSGTIDCIATDHAPHSRAQKEMPFESAPFGMIGLELAFSLTYTALVKTNVLDLPLMVQKLSYNPAKIMGLEERGVIKEGARADIAIVDLNKSWQVEEESIVSKSKNTPFLGRVLDGVITTTISQGKIVYQR